MSALNEKQNRRIPLHVRAQIITNSGMIKKEFVSMNLMTLHLSHSEIFEWQLQHHVKNGHIVTTI